MIKRSKWNVRLGSNTIEKKRPSSVCTMRMCVVEIVVNFLCCFVFSHANILPTDKRTTSTWDTNQTKLKQTSTKETMFTHFDCVPFYFRFICTTVTNYWLKFFGRSFFSLSLARSRFTRSKLHKQNQSQILFQWIDDTKKWKKIYRKKNSLNFWPNSIFWMRSQIKMASFDCYSCEWVYNLVDYLQSLISF